MALNLRKHYSQVKAYAEPSEKSPESSNELESLKSKYAKTPGRFSRALRSSAIGTTLGKGLSLQEQEAVEQEREQDPSYILDTIEGMVTLAADLPIIAGTAALTTPALTPIGGTAAGFAAAEAPKAIWQEYLKAQADGRTSLSFNEWISAAKETGKSAVIGAGLEALGPVFKAATKTPALAKLLNTPIKRGAAEAVLESGYFTAASAAVGHGELSFKDFRDNLVMVGGLKLSNKLIGKLYKQHKETGKPPEQLLIENKTKEESEKPKEKKENKEAEELKQLEKDIKAIERKEKMDKEDIEYVKDMKKNVARTLQGLKTRKEDIDQRTQKALLQKTKELEGKINDLKKRSSPTPRQLFEKEKTLNATIGTELKAKNDLLKNLQRNLQAEYQAKTPKENKDLLKLKIEQTKKEIKNLSQSIEIKKKPTIAESAKKIKTDKKDNNYRRDVEQATSDISDSIVDEATSGKLTKEYIESVRNDAKSKGINLRCL